MGRSAGQTCRCSLMPKSQDSVKVARVSCIVKYQPQRSLGIWQLECDVVTLFAAEVSTYGRSSSSARVPRSRAGSHAGRHAPIHDGRRPAAGVQCFGLARASGPDMQNCQVLDGWTEQPLPKSEAQIRKAPTQAIHWGTVSRLSLKPCSDASSRDGGVQDGGYCLTGSYDISGSLQSGAILNSCSFGEG